MGTQENNIMKACMIEASRLGATMWRNNIGAYKHPKGYYIRYGVAGVGGADLIGIYKGMFVAIETKISGKKPTEDQEKFLLFVYKAGGRSGVARCAEDVKKILDGTFLL